MSEKVKNPGLNAEDLKSRLYQSLHSSGLLKKLKGELRQSMINELRGHSDQGKRKNQRDLVEATIQKRNPSWLQQAIDNLVYLHLKQSRYQYALSLFQQESSVESYSQSLTDDLLQRLGLESRDLDITIETPSSSISENISTCPAQNDEQNMAIWRIFDKLSSNAATKTSTPCGKVKFSSFNEDEKPLSLGEKLRAIDEEMSSKTSHIPRDPAIAVSSYTAAVRRAEEDAERRAKAAFEQWKSVDLVQMKMEEAKTARDLVDSRIRQLEEDYQSKRNALVERERAAISRLNNQKELHEKEMHEQRQNLLHEIERLRMRESSLHQQEKVVHETELLKRNELKLVCDQIEQSKTPVKSSMVSPQTGSSEIRNLQRQLNEQAVKFEATKRELTSMRSEMSTAKCKQFQRENLLLRSQLEQLLHKDFKDQNPISSSSARAEENIWLKEIQKLKKEKEEEEKQHHNLASTLKEVQLALKDSNTALNRINPQARVTFASPKPEASYVQQIASTYSPSPKQDKLRQYEPVQTCLHSALYSSCEYDDPSMDERVSTAGIRLDLQQRMRDLEKQTMEVDEEYQRYLKTNYRELMEAQSQARTEHASPRLVGITASSALRSSPKNLKPTQQRQKLDFFGLEDPVELVRQAAFENQLERLGSPGSDSLKFNYKQEEITRDEPPLDFLKIHSKTENTSEVPQSGFIPSVNEDFASQQPENLRFKSDDPRHPVSKSPSPASFSQACADESSPQPERKLVETRSLPPIATPRTLPSLPQADIQASPAVSQSEASQKRDDSHQSSVKPHVSLQSTDDDSSMTDDRDSKSDLSTKNQFNFTTEIALPSRSQNLPVDQIEVTSSAGKSEPTPSNESDLSLASQSRDANRSLLQANAGVKKESRSISEKSSERSPVSTSVSRKEKLSGFTSDESISEKIVKSPLKKDFTDFDPSNDDDISAALRWGEEKQPKSLFDSDDQLSLPDKKVEARDDEDEEAPEEKEVFEMSDEDLSLDSLESGKNIPKSHTSDISW